MIYYKDKVMRNIYLGSQHLKAVKIGTEEVWPNYAGDVRVKTTPGTTQIFFRASGKWEYSDGVNSAHFPAGAGNQIIPVEPDTWVTFKFDANSYDWFYFSAYPAQSGSDLNQTTIQAIDLRSIGDITTMRGAFVFLYEVSDIQITADLSKVTDFQWAFNGLKLATEFPEIDTSSGENFQGCWNNNNAMLHYPEFNFSKATTVLNAFTENLALECIGGTIDFSNIAGNENCFVNSNNLVAPPATGTPVRSNEQAMIGVWTNPNSCGMKVTFGNISSIQAGYIKDSAGSIKNPKVNGYDLTTLRGHVDTDVVACKFNDGQIAGVDSVTLKMADQAEVTLTWSTGNDYRIVNGALADWMMNNRFVEHDIVITT